MGREEFRRVRISKQIFCSCFGMFGVANSKYVRYYNKNNKNDFAVVWVFTTISNVYIHWFTHSVSFNVLLAAIILCIISCEFGSKNQTNQFSDGFVFWYLTQNPCVQRHWNKKHIHCIVTVYGARYAVAIVSRNSDLMGFSHIKINTRTRKINACILYTAYCLDIDSDNNRQWVWWAWASRFILHSHSV